MFTSLVRPSFNPSQALSVNPINTLTAYTHARNLGIAMLPPPHVLAPNIMNNQASYPVMPPPAVSQPTYIPWPYPIPSGYPSYNMMPPQPFPATQPLPSTTDNKPPTLPEKAPEQLNVPEVLSLSQIAQGLQDKGSLVNQEIAADNLSKLIRENPDFQKLKPGAPESIVLKALHSPEPQVRLKTLVSLADDKVITVTPRVRALLKRAKSLGNTTPVEQGFVDLILNKNGRTLPTYAGLASPSKTEANNLPPLPDNLENLIKQGDKL